MSLDHQKEQNPSLARFIDHTLLKADATDEQVRKICEEALSHRFASVCVNPYYVSRVSKLLEGSDVVPCAVVGFPLGATTTKVKVAEAIDVTSQGAREVDMVIALGALKSGNWKWVEEDIKEVVLAVQDKAIVKVILETCLLTEEEKIKACSIAQNAGAHFVKTSSGFSTGGATLEDIRLMRRVVGNDLGVKASGGIKDFKTALAMIEAGANRIGTSAGVLIVSEPKATIEVSGAY
jgi:deoxyribose-phosphate aldolase